MTAARIDIYPDETRLGEHLAAQLLVGIADAAENGRPFLLGCPAGRSPGPVYSAVARRLAARPQSLSHVAIVTMDEYAVVEAGSIRLVPDDAHFSCRRYVREAIFDVWNAQLAAGWRLRTDSVWGPDPRDPQAYDGRIAEAGGVDFFILASGSSDGHVAFNPSGSPRDCPTRVIALAESTRRDNLATFPDFRSLEDVPSHGVSIGISSLARSRAAALVLWGAVKQEAFGRAAASVDYDPAWPATVIHTCPNRIVLESLEAPRLVSPTARRYGISRSLLMAWRRALKVERFAPDPAPRLCARRCSAGADI